MLDKRKMHAVLVNLTKPPNKQFRGSHADAWLAKASGLTSSEGVTQTLGWDRLMQLASGLTTLLNHLRRLHTEPRQDWLQVQNAAATIKKVMVWFQERGWQESFIGTHLQIKKKLKERDN